MEKWEVGVAFLEEIVGAINDDMTVADRAGLYGGAVAVLDQLRKVVKRDFFEDGYAYEKIHKTRWSIAAALGVDYGNGHSVSQHRSWAYGALSSLKSHLQRIESEKS